MSCVPAGTARSPRRACSATSCSAPPSRPVRRRRPVTPPRRSSCCSPRTASCTCWATTTPSRRRSARCSSCSAPCCSPSWPGATARPADAAPAEMTTQLLLAALASLLVAFMLAAAESSLSRMSRHRAAELVEEGGRGATALLRIARHNAGYLSVAAFVRVVAEAAAAVLITLGTVALVEGFWWALLVSIGVMAVLSFVLVGVSPRTLGRQHADRIALLAAPVLVWLRRVLGPVARLLVALGNAVTPGEGYRNGPFDSEAELRDLVDLAGETALIEAGERQMIHSVFELGDTVVREVMVPRTDMVTIDADKTLKQAMSLFLRTGFSRIPVVGDGPDDVLGLLYFKDVVRRVNADQESGSLPVTAQMRPMHYVPESKPVDDLLREMQRDQSHFAVVVDE